MNTRPGDHELHAYVDAALAPDDRRRVENHLAANPDDANRARAYHEQKVALRSLFDPVLDEPVPPRLESVRQEPRGRRPLLAAASLVMGVAVGWIAGAMLHNDATHLTLAHRAAVAHAVYTPEVRHPVEVPGDQREHLVGWLSKRLGAPLKAPSLAGLGYELVGGRLLPGSDSGPGAQFMYQNAAGQRLTLYVSRVAGNRSTAFRFTHEDRVSVFYWVDRAMGYALSGELPRDELLTVATAVYNQLER